MGVFAALDYYDTDALLTDEERMVRDTVREFVSGEVMPVIEKHNREATFPAQLVPRLAALGVLGANLTQMGLPGLGAVAYGVVMRELERGDSGLRSFASVQGSLVMYPIAMYGSDAQKERWLLPLHHGTAIGCFGLTEPDHGSDPGGMTTRAVRSGSEWVLNGAKAWITNGTIADVAVVWAKTDDGVRGFLVEKGTPGYSASDIKGKFALRASVTSDLALQDVRVPASSMLPGTRGLKGPLSCLSQARYGIAWGAVGAAMAVFDEALTYTKNRTQFGRPLASFQLVQNKLAWMVNEITKAQLLSLRLGRLKEEGKAEPARVSLAKMNNVNIALEIARLGRDMLGANGTHDEYQVGRHMCNLEAVKTYEGTHDIHNLIIGESVTGIAAFS
ncbi:MAG TPA: acyl-CoA dehydrogenase family protein [Verrucomicrobiae bacterium]|nr:acyl-CoA dehydrogenase family protein [Verrucomicrobiae bacterium]